MTRTRIALAGAVAAMTATALLLGGIFREPAQAGSQVGPASAPVTSNPLAEFATDGTADSISELQARLRARPADARSATLLGLAYQQRVRETADFSLLAKSEAMLRRALRLAPGEADATAGLASLALARHDFRRALTLGRKARALQPASARPYGIIGDALLELGRYEQAFSAFETMMQRKPNVASYARVSYARELLGDKTGAIEAMKLALGAASGQREALAWTHVQLGKIYFGMGRLAPADAHFRAALRAFPGYLFAFEGRAQVEAARGNHDRAATLARRAAEAVPLPQFVATLADVYRAAGDRAGTREQYDVMSAIERLLLASGVRGDLELTLFDIDHGIGLERAVAFARKARLDRPSIEGDDVLAWALARTGKCEEALLYSKRALRLGTRDAAKFFHRGMTERCLGHTDSARQWFDRALETNPYFSLHWAPVARRHAS